MRERLDLTNKRFGRLIALSPAYCGKSNNVFWHCQCDCGNLCIVNSQNLKSGKTKSCGCLRTHRCIERNKARGNEIPRNKNRLYRIYYGMRTRCYNTKDQHYKYYGARGISICPLWLESFSAFESWALSHGYDPALSIDRIDNDGNYEPSNCRWATANEQNKNKRHNIRRTTS